MSLGLYAAVAVLLESSSFATTEWLAQQTAAPIASVEQALMQLHYEGRCGLQFGPHGSINRAAWISEPPCA